jgi:cytochrome P450
MASSLASSVDAVAETAPTYDPFDAATSIEPYPKYRALRAHAPVFHNAEKDFYALSRFEDIFLALKDPATFTSTEGLTPIAGEKEILGLAPTFIMMDPPDHTRLRRLVSKAFTRERVAALDERVSDFVRGRMDRLLARMRRDGEADFVSELSSPIPTFVLAEILGVPEADRERFDPWSQAITSATLEEDKVEAAVLAVAHLFQFFVEVIERKRVEPGDDMISSLVASQREGEKLSNWDILGFCFVFIAGGNDTTNHLLGNALAALETYPHERSRVISDHSLVPNLVEEVLRYDGPVQGLSRATTRDVTLHGVHIPRGKKVHMLFASGNRDEREFGPTAERLDVTREIKRHLAFSGGPHFCIGAHFARASAKTALEALFTRAPGYVLGARTRFPSPFVRGYSRLDLRLD